MAIKVLIVDDSALMRRQLTQLFDAEAGFETRIARNGQEAIDENVSWQPDVITLDINMPVMDGITALAHIMETRPVPVVMFSSLTEKGALATFEAMALGAFDYIAKPGGTITLSLDDIRAELLEKCRAAARSRTRTRAALGLSERLRQERAQREQDAQLRKAPVIAPVGSSEDIPGIVLIGVSTGGPSTLEQILPKLPAHFPMPIVVAQHMPGSFTGPFASRMNQLCALEVSEINKPLELQAGKVYIAKGGADCVLVRRGQRYVAIAKPEDSRFIWHPSVEALGRSALELLDAGRLIAVMLTGMGYDGADAFAEIHRRGGRTIAESEDSAVVFGMPRELIERRGATQVLPATKIANQLISWTS